MPAQPGQMLSHYRLIEKLGEGGMGVVWKADDTTLDREVAVKVLPEACSRDPERLGRLKREAKAVAALNHPNIVTLHSVEEARGVHFITMELVRGKTLTESIPRNGLPLGRFFDLAVALADAIGAAHQQGITHRDLKPDNIMIGDDGRPKVLDFGLAKLREEARPGEGGTQLPTATVTQEGKILGTVSYMSPEQTEGKQIDHRSDIFSLGVLLYQMATGRRPFKGDSSASIVSSILRDTPPPVTDLNQNLPHHLGRIVRLCLHKDPERRYQTVKDLRNELAELKEEVDSGEISPATAAAIGRRGRKWPVLAVGAVAVAALAFAVYQRVARRPAETIVETTFEGMQISRLTTSGQSSAAAISPDGKYLAHVVDDGASARLWVTQVPTSSTVEIVPATDALISAVTFTPSGDFLYYLKDDLRQGTLAYQELFRIPVLGGPPRRILRDVDTSPAFSPDGERFVFKRGTVEGELHLIVANADGSGERVLATRTMPDQYGVASWSPDGKTIAVPSLDVTLGRVAIVEIPVGGGAARSISDKTWPFIHQVGLPNPDPYIVWLPDKSGLVVTVSEQGLMASNQLWLVSYPEGRARRITNDLNAYLSVDITAGGESLIAVQLERSFNLWTAPLDDPSRATRITSGAGTDHALGIAWTPDGRIVHGSNSSGSVDLWIRDADGSHPRRLTSNTGVNYEPVVSPDGRYVFFGSSRSGNFAIWRIDIDGGNPEQMTPGDDEGEMDAAVSPDGRWLVYVRPEGLINGVWRMPVEGGPSEKIFEELALASPAFSPDGRWLAVGFSVFTGEAAEEKVAILPFEPGASPSRVFDFPILGAGGSLGWSPDGRALLYVESGQAVFSISSQPLDGGQPRQLTRFDSGLISRIAVSPDGGRVLFDRGTVATDVVRITEYR